MRSALVVLGALLAVEAVALPARAADANLASSPAEAPVARLSVVLVASVDGPALRSLLEEWLAPTGLEVQLAGRSTLRVDDVLAADDDPTRVRVWLTLATPRLARLYFADPSAVRFLVRDVPLEQGLDEVGREQLAQVLLSAAQAFVERRESSPRLSVTEALSPPKVGKPAGPAPRAPGRDEAARPPSFYWSLGARYTVSVAGPGVVGHGVGATFESAIALPSARLGALTEVRYELPQRHESASLAVTLSGLALRLRVLFALVQARKRELSLELGAGLDRMLIVPYAPAGADVRPRATGTSLVPSLGGALAPFWYLGNVRLGGGLGADLALHQRYYDVLVDGERRREIRPWQLVPRAFIGVAWQ